MFKVNNRSTRTLGYFPSLTYLISWSVSRPYFEQPNQVKNVSPSKKITFGRILRIICLANHLNMSLILLFYFLHSFSWNFSLFSLKWPVNFWKKKIVNKITAKALRLIWLKQEMIAVLSVQVIIEHFERIQFRPREPDFSSYFHNYLFWKQY